MPHETTEQALTAFWAAFLGCDDEFLHSSQVVVIPRFVDNDYEGIYMLRRPEGCLCAVMSREPADLVQQTVKAIGRLRAEAVFDARFWQGSVGDRIQRIDGPAFIGYTDESVFTPEPPDAREIRPLDPKKRADSEMLRRLFAACDIEEWEHGGLDLDGSNLLAMVEGDRVLGAAGYDLWSGRIAHMGVTVHPEHRRQGVGAALLSGACQRALEEGYVPQVRALKSSHAALALAGRLGFQPWGESLVLTCREAGESKDDEASSTPQ